MERGEERGVWGADKTVLQVYYRKGDRGRSPKKKDSTDKALAEDIHLEQDWEDIQDFLIGEIGLKEVECYRTTFVEYRAYLKAHQRKNIEGWRLARFIAWQNSLVSNIKPSAKKSTAEAFWPLPLDEKNAPELEVINQQLSKDEENELFRIMSKIRRS